MSNFSYRTINYVPRMTDYEAFELLHPVVRAAVRYSITNWDSYSIYKIQKKYGWFEAWKAVISWNKSEAKRPWITYRGRKNNLTNACVEFKVSPMLDKDK